jgi:hypothetical protein
MRTFRLLAIVATVALVGCGKKEEQAQQSAMPGMQGMPGMTGMSGMKSDSLMPLMRADLDSVTRTSPHVESGTVSAHETMASQMLDAMGSDMAMMHMKPDAVWTALTDSVKRDLAELPSLSGEPLAMHLKAHIARMRRLLDMHQQMMSATGK